MTWLMEFLAFCVSPINLAYTILLGLVVFYWLTVLVGALDIEFLDIDLDLDMDGDADVEFEMDDMEGMQAGGGTSFLHNLLGYLHIGVVPITIVISVLSLFAWATAIVTHYALKVTEETAMLLLVIPVLLVAMLLTRFSIAPLVPTFKKMKNREGIAYESLIGKSCTIISGKVTETFGQAEIETGASPITLNVQINSGPDLKRGDEVVIVEKIEDQGVYVVKKV